MKASARSPVIYDAGKLRCSFYTIGLILLAPRLRSPQLLVTG